MLRLLPMVCAVCLAGCQAEIGDPGQADEGDRADAATPAPENPGDPDAAVTPPVPADATVPDLPDASALAQCAARYGGVAGFELCTAAGAECTFIALNGDVSCRAHCEAAGGLCLRAEDNDVGECFDLENDPVADCDTTGKIDLLCTCTLP